jgi:hypothetical protein
MCPVQFESLLAFSDLVMVYYRAKLKVVGLKHLLLLDFSKWEISDKCLLTWVIP